MISNANDSLLNDIILATFILVLEAHFLVRWSILARLTRISRHTCCDQSSKLLYGVFLLWAFSLLITNRNQQNISRALSHMVERVSEWERKRKRERALEAIVDVHSEIQVLLLMERYCQNQHVKLLFNILNIRNLGIEIHRVDQLIHNCLILCRYFHKLYCIKLNSSKTYTKNTL